MGPCSVKPFLWFFSISTEPPKADDQMGGVSAGHTGELRGEDIANKLAQTVSPCRFHHPKRSREMGSSR